VNIFVPSLEQTQAGVSIGGPIVKKQIILFCFLKLIKEVIQVQIL
jgi:hypothetical protein